MLVKMPGGANGQVQTVSIIDTLSELASNHGDRAKISQVSSSTPARSSRPTSLVSGNSSKHPPPPPPLNPRHPVMSVPSPMLATNISISQMSLPPHNSNGVLHNSRQSSSKLSSLSPSAFNSSRTFDDFSTGLSRSGGFLNSTMKSVNSSDVSDKRRRRRKLYSGKTGDRRGQGETPDWIKELFTLAKKGNFERLVS